MVAPMIYCLQIQNPYRLSNLFYIISILIELEGTLPKYKKFHLVRLILFLS
jgi:hypothetical protein